jgi:hypothetical protein
MLTRRGLEPPPAYVDQHLKLRIAWSPPSFLRENNGLTPGLRAGQSISILK